MKRKVIQIADSTQLISLPRKWAQLQNIKKGDELDIEEKGSQLIIKSDKSSLPESKKVDLRDYELIAHRYLSALYKSGYDEMNVTFDSPSELKTIQDTVNNEFIGFEIIEEGKNHLITKSVSSLNISEFKDMLRRTFLFLLSMSNDSIDAMKKKDNNTLENISLRDSNVNKLTDYCRRLLNKKGADLYAKSCPIYYIIESLEKIGDEYRDLCKIVMDSNKAPNDNIIKIYEDINIFLKEFYELFHNFDIKRLESFIKKKPAIETKIDKILDGKLQPFEIKMLIKLYNLIYMIFDMNGSLMTAYL